MILLGIPLTDTAMRRRMPIAWPWIKDITAGALLILLTVECFAGLDLLAKWLQASGWAE